MKALNPPTGFYRYCGPAVLSSLALIERGYAAEIIDEIRREEKSRLRISTGLYQLEKAFKLLGYTTNIIDVKEPISVKQYISAHTTGQYVVLAHRHFISVWDGIVLEDNGIYYPNSRVDWVLEISLK